MTKHIVLDAYQDSEQITGTDRMARNYLLELQRIDSINSYTVICSDHSYIKDSIRSHNFRYKEPPLKFKTPLLRRAYNYIWRRMNTAKLWMKKPDTYYSFHNMRLPRIRTGKLIIASNLDLIPIVLDEYKGVGRLSFKKQKRLFKNISQRADKIISISAFSKNELINVLQAEPSKIEIIPLAADIDMEHADIKNRVLKSKYILTIGGSEPRKNVSIVIEAYCRLSKKLQNQYKLVIAGGTWQGKKLDTRNNENIIILGYVEDNLLPSLYANATAFVFASKYEGFGFTILEAMTFGTPVINAMGSSLDEVSGNATLRFNPLKSEELLEQLNIILSTPTLRKELSKKGIIQKNKFTWTDSGKKLHDVLINSNFSV